MSPTPAPVVLLADDDDLTRNSLRYVLAHDDYEIIECANGVEAVAACQRQLPDVVLLDICMPQLDGIAACEQIQHLPGDQHVPVLMITALDDRASIDRCFEAGATDYITKPINLAILRQRVRRLARARQTEVALRESEEKYRTLFREMLDGFALHEILYDEQGNPADYRFLIVNPAFERMTGLKAQDIVGRTVLEALPGTERFWIETYGQVALTGEPAFFENYSAGLKKHFQVTAFRPAPNQFASIFVDITDRKQAEEEIGKLNQDLEHRARELAALNKANQIIASTLDLDVVLRLVLNEVRTLLNAEGASVLLYDPPGNTLIFAAAVGPDSDKLVRTRLPATVGVAGWVLQHSQPARIDDAQSDPRFYDRIDTLTGLTTRSLLAMPLAIEKTPHQGVIEVVNKIGVTTQASFPHALGGNPEANQRDSPMVSLDARQKHASRGMTVEQLQIGGVFDDHDLELLASMARSAALTIENARLYQAEQQQREFSETLREIGAALVTSLDVDTVLDRLLEQVRRVIPYDAANIMLIAGDQAQVARWRGYERFGTEDAINAIHLLITSTPTLRQMLETGEPIFIANTQTDVNWIHMPESDWLQSYTSVPIRVRNEIIGFLNLGSITAGFFGPLHAEQLSAFASQAAIALENARLYQIEREQFERLQESQAQLIQAEKMGALGRLAAALAHEINNPLQAIQSYLELVMDFPLEDGERLEYLQIARREINRLNQITRNVLNFARPTPGPRRLASINDLIRQTLALAGKQLEHNHIQVTTDLQPTPPMFMAAEQMTQVFLNLVLNAVEAIQQNGQLHITSRVECDQIVIGFIDDGPAIRPEDLGHIFEPFYTTKPGGTGLGLSISHRLVQQHGGSLIVENVTDTRGVVFKISLPLAASSEPMSVS